MDQILISLKKCWASGFSERALSYRVERGLPLSGIAVGVVIQKMVNATSAGVAFSRNPIRCLDRDSLLVSSVWGLGEGLVSGADDGGRSDRAVENRAGSNHHSAGCLAHAGEAGLSVSLLGNRTTTLLMPR